MNIEEAWAKRPTDTYYAVYGALGDSADEDIEDWGRDLMLAVLDEAEECVVPPSAGWDDEALRDRIQARR